MKKLIISLLLTGSLLLSFSACKTNSAEGTDSSQPEISAEDENPTDSAASTESLESSNGLLSSFSTTDVNGNAADQSILADHTLTMVNVWATYCGPCLNEMPELGELAEEYQGKDVAILGLVTDVLDSDGSLNNKQIATAREVIQSTRADYLHIVPSQDLFGILSQITSVPTTFFVDAQGNQVGEVYVGSRSKADWAAIIDETLQEAAK